MEYTPAEYWERRAARFARNGDGRAAVCSFGMPAHFNGAIDLCQRLALRRWVPAASQGSVLDIGCGVGRWSRRLARRGAIVTGIDLSPTMIAEAERHSRREGLADRCRFIRADLTSLDLGQRFDTVWCVTVLQHVLAASELVRAVAALARHLRPGGRAVALEVAPSVPSRRCDSAVFTARTADQYIDAFTRAGLRCASVGGVDPSRLRVAFLPHYRSLPRPFGAVALAAVTALSLPIDFLFGRAWTGASWHKVFVLTKDGR